MADISEPGPIGALMPVDKHGQQRKRRKSESHQRPDPVEAHDVSDVTDIMGISIAEMTPQVQETLTLIMTEFDKSRIELEHARSHIKYLEELADRHPVLPLLNRRGLHRELSRTLALAARDGVTNSFLCFQVLNSEDIHRRLGREAAEAILILVAETLTAGVRDSDIVGSLGGRDFGVILTVADDEPAAGKAASLARALGQAAAHFQDHALVPQVAYGVHTFSAGDTAESILRCAEQDLLART